MSRFCPSATIATLGLDLGKNSFHLVGQDERGAIVLRIKLSRAQLIPTRVKADSFRGFQTGASQTLWRRTGGSPCGQGLHFVRTMMQPSFGP